MTYEVLVLERERDLVMFWRNKGNILVFVTSGRSKDEGNVEHVKLEIPGIAIRGKWDRERFCF